ncbi:MAG: AbrB/MazE/SpoVT family DNA-binding domain-containing protein [Thermodesulfovibrionales bacterium]|nr:AbrB/MazE/SpoVT family DNA-binding domain-containing protein [Thermodesulfovibrionales bacterium]
MLAKTAKWGHSLALRIPKAISNECGINENTMVDISSKGNKIIITPVREEEYSLEKLLSSITKDNIYSEVDFGKPAGKELI